MELVEYLSEINKTEKLELFEEYYQLLTEWNEKINLTAITEKSDVFLKHFCDSLLGNEFVIGNRVLDIGAGAGFPSLALAIVRDDINFTLVDSVDKKVRFMKEVASKLGLSNVNTIHSRAEDLDKSVLYDCCVSRAVARLNVLSEYCLPFLKIGGRMVAYKADDCEEEINESKKAISLLGGKIEKVEKRLLDDQTVRSFVLIKKVSPTQNRYPRSGNKPRLSPLI